MLVQICACCFTRVLARVLARVFTDGFTPAAPALKKSVIPPEVASIDDCAAEMPASPLDTDFSNRQTTDLKNRIPDLVHRITGAAPPEQYLTKMLKFTNHDIPVLGTCLVALRDRGDRFALKAPLFAFITDWVRGIRPRS